MEEIAKPSQPTPIKLKEKSSYIAVAFAKTSQTPSQPWTKVSYKNQKIRATPIAKTK